MVEYRKIGDTEYFIGSNGDVISPYTKQKMRQHKMPNGYMCVTISKHKERYVHRLVATAFLEKPKNENIKYEVAHADGSRDNNDVSNLRWATKSENHMDKIIHGTALRGDTHNMRKLTSKDVIEIRKKHRLGIMQKDLAIEYKVSKMAICRVVNYILWRHIK